MKGATLLARRLLEELTAYRSEQEAKDILSEVMAMSTIPGTDQIIHLQS